MAKGDTLRNAKGEKKDEFYTRLEDIEAEISNHQDYVKHFKGKTVFCNCDDPDYSNFFEFFKLHFKQLGIKKLITTHYNKQGNPSYKSEWWGDVVNGDIVNNIDTPLKGDGDFRSEECIEILKEADIVVTNPPFSLFREYTAQLMEYNKKFIILGNNNAILYKEFFQHLKEGRVWLGYSYNKTYAFKVGEGYKYDEAITKEINDGNKYGKVPAISWFTNLELDKKHEPLVLTKNYNGNEEKYPHYFNYDAIDVSNVKHIPKDYYGKMGVPVTFFGQYCPDQFEIIGLGTYVPKTKKHVAYKNKNVICYEVDGVAVWTTPYTEKERKIGNSLRIEKNGLPDSNPYGRIIIKRKVGDSE